MRILYIGKFQPFHLGHLQAVNIIKSLSDKILIAIGSPKDIRYFSLDERIRMIEENTSIKPNVVDNLDDGHPLYLRWGRYVLDLVGGVDIVATGNPHVKRDFYKEGKHILFFKRDEKRLSGKIIRNAIESNSCSWRALVPDKSIKIIEDSEYYKRMQNNG